MLGNLRVCGCSLVLMLSGGATAYGAEGVLKIAITGVRRATGQVCVAVWSTPEDYKKIDFRKGQGKCVPAQVPETTIEVTAGTDKDLALAVLHDENRDNILDTNFVGMPKEGFAFSNNAKGKFGAPKWEQVVFQMKEATLKMRLNLIYL